MSGYADDRLLQAPGPSSPASPPPDAFDTEGVKGREEDLSRELAAAPGAAAVDRHDAVGILVELHAAIDANTRRLDAITAELRPAHSTIEDVDLVAIFPNAGRTSAQRHAALDRALQVDNPYAVSIEVRASSDGGGPIIMRVPPRTSRVLTANVREVSLKVIGAVAPLGAIPATVVRFDRPQPAGLYAYAP